MIEIRNIHKHYGATAVLRGLFLSMDPGECLALLGPSGCGKTTLLRLIAGLETPDSGEIRIKGKVVSTFGKQVPPYRRSVGMVFQDLALWPHMTVQKQIEFVMAPVASGKLGRYRRIEQILQQVRLEDLAHLYPHQLSGGEKQRLALGRALAQNPRILLLDEPLSGLDSKLRSELLVEIQQVIRSVNVTTIYVTHDRREAEFIADRTARMDGGRIEAVRPVYRPENTGRRRRTGTAPGHKIIWLNAYKAE
jgi:iron(III) transport system ATP-binding protein